MLEGQSRALRGRFWRSFQLLRSEIPSGICAKLRTVAASNNRVHSLRVC